MASLALACGGDHPPPTIPVAVPTGTVPARVAPPPVAASKVSAPEALLFVGRASNFSETIDRVAKAARVPREQFDHAIGRVNALPGKGEEPIVIVDRIGRDEGGKKLLDWRLMMSARATEDVFGFLH